jgi:F-type H+-transporting ATPase subunit delta
MSLGAVAERYAHALFELGTESGHLGELSDKLGDFAEVYESSAELRATLTDPTLSAEQKRDVLAGIAKRLSIPDLGLKGLHVMAARGRLGAILATVRRLTELADQQSGLVRAQVTTAVPMPETFYQELCAELERSTRKEIVLKRSVDESLIGGAIAQVGDQVIDGSVRGRLQRAEREIRAAVVSGASASS